MSFFPRSTCSAIVFKYFSGSLQNKLNLLHITQQGGDDELAAGGGLDLVDGELGPDLGQDHALVGHFEHAHFGDDFVHAFYSS